ncbi:sugar ABC transporter permease [Streptococcus suis]|uniref:Sugar ABC transporter permease n=1 Tax=Streptococcus suis TaxID=1307 RepID=A0AB33U274_STRSU|nr:sugar ABC transporter permease [Streptococcus suis]CYY06088.1 sugar ABC transporter permease [Streptococcus suis]
MTITMMIFAVVGGPVAMIFPTSYIPLANEGLTGAGLAYLGAIGVTIIYVLVFTKIAAKKFKNLEF